MLFVTGQITAYFIISKLRRAFPVFKLMLYKKEH